MAWACVGRIGRGCATAGPESAARPAVARPKRAAGGGGGTHVPSQPAQQPRSTADINMRGPRGLRPALPGVARARPRPRPKRLGDLEEGGKEEERAVPCRVRDGRAQGFAPSRRRGQPEAAPRIPRCCRGEPGPARPGRKTEAAGRGGAGPGGGRGLKRAGPGPGWQLLNCSGGLSTLAKPATVYKWSVCSLAGGSCKTFTALVPPRTALHMWCSSAGAS